MLEYADMIHGTCLCATLQYTITGPVTMMVHCHCSMCRKHHGTGYATFVGAPLQTFQWQAGKDAVRTWQSSARGTRSFCSGCGSVAPLMLPEQGLALCPAGNLDDDPGTRPGAHLFVASMARWDRITDDLPQYDGYPPDWNMHGVERPPVSVQEGVTQGSCLCGEIAFQLNGPALRMTHCHCRRCRQARSAAHATNVFYADTAFRWIRGEQLVQEYKVPDARYFTVAFCRTCGSELPRVSPERGIVVVPAGSLDSDPGIRPQHHIHVASRASWTTIADELPQFNAGLPPT